MEHAEAHERLADLALEPRALGGLASAEDPASRELRSHVAGCQLCSADVAGWLRTWAALGAGDRAVPDLGAGDPRVLVPPAELRTRIMRAIEVAPASSPASPSPIGRPSGSVVPFASRAFGGIRRRAVGLVAIAAVVAALLAGGVAIQSRLDLQHSRSDAAALASIESSVGRILAEPGHSEVPLLAADGSTGGVLAWSDAEFAVLTSDLAVPAEGQTYRCWIELNGKRTVLGDLSFSGSMAAWAGPMGSWQWYFTPGAKFGVSLFSTTGSSGAPILAATL